METRLVSVETIVAGLGTRMNRMFLAMIAGLIIVATVAGVLLTV